MSFAKWLRAVWDALSHSRRERWLEDTLLNERNMGLEQIQYYETGLSKLRQDLTERLRDKDAVINDLRLRLAVAEADKLRAEMAKMPRPAMPVPEFDGPVPFQDELKRMTLELEENEETDHAI